MNKVYIVQVHQHYNKATGELEEKFDFSAAEKFGEIEVLMSPTAKPFDADPIVNELYIKLQDITDDDYMICTGNPGLMVMAFAVAADLNGGRIKMLQWNGRKQEYIPIQVDFGDAFGQTVRGMPDEPEFIF